MALLYRIPNVACTGMHHGIWKKFMDREYMRYHTFPRAGKLAGSTGNILEVGCEGYNADDYKMCGVLPSNFYFVDVFSRAQWGGKNGHTIEMKFSEMTNFSQYHSMFDVIIDYGALGYGGTIWKEVYSDAEIIKHIAAYHTLLKPGGMLLMKWDFGQYAVGKGQKEFWPKWRDSLRKNFVIVHEYLQMPSHLPETIRSDMLKFLADDEDAPRHRVIDPYYTGNFTSRELETLLYLEYMEPINYTAPHGALSR